MRVCITHVFCIVQVTLTLFFRQSHYMAMIYIKTYFPHDCQCMYSISVIKVCIR